jgi:hypothetical protein
MPDLKMKTAFVSTAKLKNVFERSIFNDEKQKFAGLG